MSQWLVLLIFLVIKQQWCNGFVPSSTTPLFPRSMGVHDNRISRMVAGGSPLRIPFQMSSTAATFDIDATTTDISSSNTTSTLTPTKPFWRTSIFARAALALFIYALGYVAGGGSARVATRQILRQPRRFPILSAIGMALLCKEFYSAIPVWVKRKLPIAGRKHKTLASMVVKDPDDMTDVGTIALKLRNLFEVVQVKLVDEQQDDMEEKKLQVLAPLMALTQTLRQYRESELSTQAFQDAGKEGTPKDIEGYDEAFEFADWAYDEDPSGIPLKELLQREGFSLLRHDQTTLPGYVGHYVALSKEKKLAIIGVKGTSTLEDVLTDCCGLAVPYELPGPFVEGGKTEIRCHEGILISAKRLADDLQTLVEDLLLPTGYQILVVGHSLGAAAASLFAVMLRSRIPALRNDKGGKRLSVLAFASPPVLDYDNALDCRSFCTTIVNNSDIIPRASLANLIIALEVLKRTNEKLKEKNLDYETNKKALVRKLVADSVKRKVEEKELLMGPEDLVAIADDAIGTVDKRDPDHLYVPGKVVLLCEKTYFGKDGKNEKGDGKTANDNEETLIVLADNGTTDVLRLIFVDDRMITDHLAPGYRSIIRSSLKKSDVATV